MKKKLKRFAVVGLLIAFLAVIQGCAPAAKTLPNASDAAKAVLAGQAFHEPFEIEREKALELLNLPGDNAADLAMFMDASLITPECVVIITATNADAGRAVEQALKNRRQALKTQYESYRPEEVYKTDQAVLDNSGLQYALVISPSGEAAVEALRAVWR